MSCGVPTVWLGLLQHLRTSGERLDTVEVIMTGGSAAPPLLIDAFRDQAADPNVSFSWFDAAVLTEKAREQAGRCIEEEPLSRSRI